MQLFLGPQSFREMTVKAVMDGWFFNSGQYQVVMAVSLGRAQGLLDKEGRLSYILVSNTGDDEEGVELTESVVGRHGDLPALVNNGLEMHDVKQEGIDFANEWGNLFLSFFTVFGLFSIGVGLLLIFLIFSMLAAERKAELGMSRAIGMKPRASDQDVHCGRGDLWVGVVGGRGFSGYRSGIHFGESHGRRDRPGRYIRIQP